ncbi:MAG: FCD domain-containing protein [Lactobacillaceae bacterium]|nr:FCD domain-containing protein [Lactobacillaceae bacterium]
MQLQSIYLNSNDYAPFFQLDDQFHQYFYQVTATTYTWDWIQTISMPVNRFRYLRLKLMDLSWDEILHQHQTILNALEQQQTELAQQTLCEHIHLMDHDLFQATHLFPRYFG